MMFNPSRNERKRFIYSASNAVVCAVRVQVKKDRTCVGILFPEEISWIPRVAMGDVVVCDSKTIVYHK